MREFINDQVNENSSTNHEAVLCKVSADQCGLLPDKFIAEFVNHPHHHGNPRRQSKPPIINRGTFLRTVSIDSITKNFFERSSETGKPFNIISLGSGFDTRLFRFTEEFGQMANLLKYFELDFAQIIEEKRRIVESKPNLKELSRAWRPIACDLNETTNLSTVLGEDFDPSFPTLIIAECCLMYLTASAGDEILAWAGKTVSSVVFCSFDPILSEHLELDRFAQTMLTNFENRGLDTRALLEYPSKSSILQRFRKYFRSATGFTMLDLESDEMTEFLVSKQQRREVAIKTALDEYEEWRLLADHYLLIIATE